jgi:hypothetical protein
MANTAIGTTARPFTNADSLRRGKHLEFRVITEPRLMLSNRKSVLNRHSDGWLSPICKLDQVRKQSTSIFRLGTYLHCFFCSPSTRLAHEALERSNLLISSTIPYVSYFIFGVSIALAIRFRPGDSQPSTNPIPSPSTPNIRPAMPPHNPNSSPPSFPTEIIAFISAVFGCIWNTSHLATEITAIALGVWLL